MTYIETEAADILLGGWNTVLEILLIVMALDYLTGVANAFKSHSVSSSAGYKGLVKKSTIFIIVILSAQIDKMLGPDNHLFRDCTAISFSINDALSILENAGSMGLKFPAFLYSALVKIQKQADNTGDKAVEAIHETAPSKKDAMHYEK